MIPPLAPGQKNEQQNMVGWVNEQQPHSTIIYQTLLTEKHV